MRRLNLLLVVVLLGAACGDAAVAADPQRFCEIDAELDTLFEALSFSPNEAREAADEMSDLLDESVRVAPDEIRLSVEKSRDWLMRFLDIAAAGDFDSAKADQAALGALFQDEEAETASDAIADWTDANCSN